MAGCCRACFVLSHPRSFPDVLQPGQLLQEQASVNACHEGAVLQVQTGSKHLQHISRLSSSAEA